MNIEHLKLFIRIATTHNISLAGSELRLSPAVASAHINKLEAGLGVRLIHRTTRRVSLTEEGKAFFPYAENVISSIEAARASVGAGNSLPRGTLRVAAPASFGRMHILPAITHFLTLYPGLNVDLKLSDTIVDLVEGGFDVAIRNSQLKDSSLIARKLASDNRILCASPTYLTKNGEPISPEELKSHQCITLMGLDNWLFYTPKGQVNIKAKGNFRTDNGEAVRDACINGLGITINSKWSVYKHLSNGDLIQILNDYPIASDAAIWAIYPSSRLLAPKVRAFIDYFTEHFGGTPYWE
ncbi:LysR family transcriptional regulator [Glaciecola sp. 33A]|jgi:DNA-binding transcriptional LysR family regulator|uniref:LysR family transcriptional regulator n=1 Tax=Glaciecola sp. 33A TaxID=2057807 RepID=UPI000C333149|nr:LysR family transcriptional regulator [Glaciecola sp. 33A]PKI03482.1 LysR family transcriptional regulator [Glaciecola sp. 33A]